jgi:hypothetical protein
MTTLRRVATTAAVLTCATLGVASNAAAVTKSFAVDLAPDSAPASRSIVYTAKITNTLTPQNQRLGSVDLTVPSEWEVLGTTRGTVAGSVVQLRGLDLAPGQSTEVGVRVDTSGVAGTWEWTARGKQANDFNGQGNDFVADPVRTDLTAEIETSAAHDVDCPQEPVAVGKAGTVCTGEVVWQGEGPINDDGTPVENDAAPLTPGSTTRSAAAAASAVTTTSFRVTVSAIAYPSAADQLPNEGVLSLRVPAQQLNCNGPNETSPVTALIDGPPNRAKTVSVKVDAGVALAAATQGMCFAGPVPFTPDPANAASVAPVLYEGSVFFQGTLPACNAAFLQVQPCVSFRSNAGGNNATTTELPAIYPDPAYRP